MKIDYLSQDTLGGFITKCAGEWHELRLEDCTLETVRVVRTLEAT